MNILPFKEYPDGEKPYEKFWSKGVESLSDAELIAVILRSGTKEKDVLDIAKTFMAYKERSLMNLWEMSTEEMMRIPGIGKVKATQLKCIAQLCVRINQTAYMPKDKYDNANKIANYYMEFLRHRKQEHLVLLMLDTKCHKLGEEIIFKGTVNSSIVSPREIFLHALNKKAVQIILLHNHPSGDCTPSREDLVVTERIRYAGEMIGINLVDHIIIGDNTYTSFKEEGLL